MEIKGRISVYFRPNTPLLERRAHPRFETEFPAEIRNARNEALPGTVLNLSRAGLLLRCHRHTVMSLLPEGFLILPCQMMLQVRLMLPLPPHPQDVETVCKVVATRRLAVDEFRINLHFVDFAGDGEEILDGFIRKLAEGRRCGTFQAPRSPEL
jgi:hypothetical protein